MSESGGEAVFDSDGDLVVGAVFGGFRVEERVGRGGMSVLYRVTEVGLGRSVALKVMAAKLSADQQFRERFTSEARAASVLDHPHVVPVFASGECEGRLFIAMRFVAGGEDLRKLLKRERQLSAAVTVGLLVQAAAALDAVHEAVRIAQLERGSVVEPLELLGA